MLGKRNIVGISFIVILLVSLFFLARQPSLFPVSTVKVEGDYWHISQTRIKNIVNQATANSSYFTVNLKAVRAELLKNLPWAKTVTVSKQWPGKLIILINQKQAIAIWNNVALLQENGQLFYPLSSSFPKDLPVFESDDTNKTKVIEQYQHMQSVLTKNDMNGELAITQIKITSQGNCLVTFNQKIVVMLGNMNILAMFRRFIAIYKQVFESKQKIPEYVDMRYSHGLAVKWGNTN